MTDSPQGPRLFVGLMSGTSMDGIDAALVELDESRCVVRAAITVAYPDELRAALQAASRAPASCTVDEIGRLDRWTGEAFRDAALTLLEEAGVKPGSITAIGSHGQTLRHLPGAPRPFTLQIGDPNVIAAGTGITTVADFRRRDLALGGEGAPLAPAFHRWLFASDAQDRVVLNIGGFANLTVLPATGEVAAGFDTGPGNTLMDTWCQQHRGERFDADGRWAAAGKVDDALLAALGADPYFDRAPPKSTGFEYFNRTWLERHLAAAGPLRPQDVQATLAELTAGTVAQAIDRHAREAGDVLVCGGGARNGHLLARLAARLPGRAVRTTAASGIEPEWIEAAAFAWLAARCLDGLPGNLPAVTGASAETVLGAIYPRNGLRTV